MSKREAQVEHKKWQEMNAVEKITWCGKLVVALLSFGFVFPHIMDPFL